MCWHGARAWLRPDRGRAQPRLVPLPGARGGRLGDRALSSPRCHAEARRDDASQRLARVRRRPRTRRCAHITVPAAVAVAKWAHSCDLRGAHRYLASDCAEHPGSRWTEDDYTAVRYARVPLLGRTLSFTVDLSSVGCGCVASVYLVPMADMTQPGSCGGDYYCARAHGPPTAARAVHVVVSARSPLRAHAPTPL